MISVFEVEWSSIMKKYKLNNDFKKKKLSDDQISLKKILSPLEFRRDLLIEHLHKIQDYFGYLSEKNLGRYVGRNPFNKGGLYSGYLFKLKDFKKSNCLNQG